MTARDDLRALIDQLDDEDAAEVLWPVPAGCWRRARRRRRSSGRPAHIRRPSPRRCRATRSTTAPTRWSTWPGAASCAPVTEKKTIRQLREERGWTQQTMAWQLGLEQSAVSAWERGQRVPRPRNLRRLAELFGVSVEAIAFGPADHPPQDRP